MHEAAGSLNWQSFRTLASTSVQVIFQLRSESSFDQRPPSHPISRAREGLPAILWARSTASFSISEMYVPHKDCAASSQNVGCSIISGVAKSFPTNIIIFVSDT